MMKEQAEIVQCAENKKEASKFCALQNGEASLTLTLTKAPKADEDIL